jgi:hypothetical protein
MRITEVSDADAKAIIDRICSMIDTVRERLTSEEGRRHLEQGLYELLHKGTLPMAQVIAWAQAGNPAAERALRLYLAEHLDQDRYDELPTQARGYLVGLTLRPLLPYPPGHTLADTWVRDIIVAVIVRLMAASTGLAPTRSRSTTQPSVAYFVSLAFRKKGFSRLKERWVNQICYDQAKIAARLEAFMPKLSSPL